MPKADDGSIAITTACTTLIAVVALRRLNSQIMR